ncbi:hypothetical protein FRC17_009951 [Serendipita sp. 399]|nr:hypothetical protein FRC17_009951 [Serendipita sp. 399]
MNRDMEIQRLEIQLAQAVARRAQLMKEIEHDAVTLANHNWLPIPEDIVIVIFCSLVFPNPAIVRHLMLVCRHWHSVITNTPILWSVINLRPSNNLTLLSSWTDYCRACIQRSGSSPLEVTIDYREVIEPKFFAAVTIYPAWIKLHLAMKVYSFFKTFCHFMPAYTAEHFVRFEAPVRELIGADCSGVSRWKALTVEGTGWDYRILSLIRRCLGGDALPKRSWYWTAGITCRFPIQSKRHDPRGPDTTTKTLFPSNAPPLQYLNIPLVIPLGSVDPRSVYEMEIACQGFQATRLILPFRQLKRLAIVVYCRHISPDLSLKPGDVEFPHLVELDAQSNLPPDFWAYLDAPRLETIRFGWGAPENMSTCPAVTLIDVGYNPDNGRLLESLIRAFPSLKAITCHGFRKEHTARAARLYVLWAGRAHAVKVTETSFRSREVQKYPRSNVPSSCLFFRSSME